MYGTTELLVDGVHDQDHPVRQELRGLVYPSAIDLSSRTLRFLSRQLAARRGEVGTRWRRLSTGRQALLALPHLRCGDTYARLATGFRIGIATAYRYVREAIDVLAALAPTLTEAMATARRKAFVILDGTLLLIDRIAADRPYYSGKHKRHGMTVQVLTDPFGRLIWASSAHPGSIHDLTGARGHGLVAALADADLECWADRATRAPAATSASRSEAGNSNDGSGVTTPPTPRSGASANRPWPP